jgi:hypothetical protein
MKMSPADNGVFDGGTLTALLAERARAATDRRLAVEAGLGLVVLTVAAIFQPPLALPLAAFALSVAMFGTWGIVDRELAEIEGGTVRKRRVLNAVRVLAATVGALAAVLGALVLFFGILGRWMS